nr:uncharacterized protein LOC132598023 [Globicephala melas]XP_060162954.1 uncharacterized protein LOC132598024 [Globicephala melas]
MGTGWVQRKRLCFAVSRSRKLIARLLPVARSQRQFRRCKQLPRANHLGARLRVASPRLRTVPTPSAPCPRRDRLQVGKSNPSEMGNSRPNVGEDLAFGLRTASLSSSRNFPRQLQLVALTGARHFYKPVLEPYFTRMQTHLNHRLVFRRLFLLNGAINPECQAGWSGARTGERWKGNESSRESTSSARGATARSAPEGAPPYLEKPQDVGYHAGDRTPRSPNHSNYFLGLDENRRLAVGAAHFGGVLLDERLDESERLFERISVPGTSVQDPRSQRHVGQQVGIAVDLVQGVEHRFQPVDPVLPLDVAAGHSAGTLRVHREQPPEGDVPLDPNGVRGVHLLAARRRRRQRAQKHLQHAAGKLHQSQGAEQLPQLDRAAPAAAAVAAALEGTVAGPRESWPLGVSSSGEAQGLLRARRVGAPGEGQPARVGGPAAPASLGRRALSGSPASAPRSSSRSVACSSSSPTAQHWGESEDGYRFKCAFGSLSSSAHSLPPSLALRLSPPFPAPTLPTVLQHHAGRGCVLRGYCGRSRMK